MFLKTILRQSSLLLFPAFCLFAQAPPPFFEAEGLDSHMELRWQPAIALGVTGYQLFRSDDGGQSFDLLKAVGPGVVDFIDWTGDEGTNISRQYTIRTLAEGGMIGPFSDTLTATTHVFSDEELLDMVQRYTFRYFWDFAHPQSGMARERNISGNTVTTGGSGFGLLSIITGIERGWITREQGVDRMLQIVSFLQICEKYHGALPHWINGASGQTIPFSAFDNGGDLVETAFMMQGLLISREYFDQNNAIENTLRDVITELWEGVEWDWYRRNNSNVLYWHWSPQYQWQMNFQLRGFNETQITYLLAVASPTHGVPASLYQTGWAGSNYTNNNSYYGYQICCGPFAGGPLFFAHYSFLGFDPRNKKDAYCNYFVRNRNHALIHQAYCNSNPENHEGYSADCWGLTASDNPWGYLAHDPFPPNDNGTIAPTAALASMPYTPQESMKALKHFYRILGDRLWGPYGFYDAFNLNQNWFATSYLAIDQGPIVAMIENHRTGLFWDLFMQAPGIQSAVSAVGFVPDASSTHEAYLKAYGFDAIVRPNPATSGTLVQLELQMLNQGNLQIELFDAVGVKRKDVLNNAVFVTGIHNLELHTTGLEPGLYFLLLKLDGGKTRSLKLSVL